MSSNVFSLVRSRLARPQTTLFRLPDGSSISYAQAFERSGRLANLLTLRGIRPGDRVAVQVEKSVEAVMLYLACLRAGAIYLPLNSAYTANELDYFIGDAQPGLLVCRPEQRQAAAALADRHHVPHVETLADDGSGSLASAASECAPSFDDVSREAGDLAAILYTSGTTGRSKGAMITHGNLASNALTLVDFWRFTESDVLLHALPIFHVHGLFVAINVSLMAGGSMIFLPRFDADQVIRHLPEATTMMGVPTFYTRLLQHPGLTREAAGSVRVFISGSAPLLAETHARWLERTGHAILERYGMTETGMITSNPYDGERIAGTVGFPLPGIELRIADLESGTVLPQGETGIIELRGPNVFKGYWNMPEKTQAEFRPDGFFITGDVGRIDARGYLHIVGRAKDLIISGGYNVYPKEIETEVDAIAGVSESAVIGVPHPDFGEGVTAIVIRTPGAELSEAQVIARLTGRLAKFKLPKRVIFVDELPRNAMGKVEKKTLRERYAGLYAA